MYESRPSLKGRIWSDLIMASLPKYLKRAETPYEYAPIDIGGSQLASVRRPSKNLSAILRLGELHAV